MNNTCAHSHHHEQLPCLPLPRAEKQERKNRSISSIPDLHRERSSRSMKRPAERVANGPPQGLPGVISQSLKISQKHTETSCFRRFQFEMNLWILGGAGSRLRTQVHGFYVFFYFVVSKTSLANNWSPTEQQC